MDKTKQLMPTKTGFSSLTQPWFSFGMVLEDDDLNVGVSYTHELTRLLFRSFFGCGVVCGLKVKAKPICNGSKLLITIARGLALDCMGNPLDVRETQTIEYAPDCKPFEDAIWVVLCYFEKRCRPKDVSCGEEDGQSKATRVRIGYEIKLYDKAPKCACQCAKDSTDQQTANPDGCCDEAETTATQPVGANQPSADTPANSKDPCSCYLAHYNGECSCECGCNCVVIAKILPNDVPAKDANGNDIPAENRFAKTEDDMVRRIRPVLNGYLQCRDRQVKTFVAETPKPNEPPPKDQPPLTPQ